MWLETTFSKREPVSLSWVVILAFLHHRQGFRTFSRSPVFKSAGSQVPKSLTARKFVIPGSSLPLIQFAIRLIRSKPSSISSCVVASKHKGSSAEPWSVPLRVSDFGIIVSELKTTVPCPTFTRLSRRPTRCHSDPAVLQRLGAPDLLLFVFNKKQPGNSRRATARHDRCLFSSAC